MEADIFVISPLINPWATGQSRWWELFFLLAIVRMSGPVLIGNFQERL
jgi:hypothetical protein